MTIDQNITVANEIREIDADMRLLNIDEIDATSGAGFFSRIGSFLKSIFSGPGDLRRSTDRPE